MYTCIINYVCDSTQTAGDCLDHIYVMGFTGGNAAANAPETAHEIVIRANGETQHSILPDLPNDDFQQHKGDLWKLHLQNDFHFVQTCIKLEDIEYIALKERHDDAWQIDSVVTFFRSGASYQLATMDIDIFLWLEGNSDAPGPSHRRIELTRVI